MVNFYNLLKVSPTASEEEIKKAINRELRVWSNRQNTAQMERRQEAERMVKQLEEAERILLDAAQRKEYDLQLQAGPTATGRVDESVIHEGVDLVQEGWRLLIAGNIAEAISVATQATQRDSGNPEAWALLGQTKYRWGEIEDAIYEYKRAINLRPNEASYYFDLGCVYESAERWSDALLQFQRAAQIDPATPMYRAAIGIVLLKNEKYREAMEILERCLQEEPDNDSFKEFLAIAYHESMVTSWWRNPDDGLYYCISKAQADEACDLISKAKALEVSDPGLRSQIAKSERLVESLYKRKFKGSWILVGIWGLCYLLPGLFWYLVNLRPQYKINRDIHDIIEEGKKDSLVGGEAGVYFSALPPGMRWAAYSLPRFVVWFLILLLSPITFFYLLYDNYLSDGNSISLYNLGLSREKVPVTAAIGLGVLILVAGLSVFLWWPGKKAPSTLMVAKPSTPTYQSNAVPKQQKDKAPVSKKTMVPSPLQAASERILLFSSHIVVHPDASLTVTENITVRSEQREIKRGIIRDFPTTYKDRFGNTVKVGFEILEVLRDGKTSPYHTEHVANGEKIYIGARNVNLSAGVYTYTIKYRTDRQLGYFKDFDELYWNVTGNGWTFPIETAEAVIELPPGARILEHAAYTGYQGDRGQDFMVHPDDTNIVFKTTRGLAPREGLTVVVSWPKGLVR